MLEALAVVSVALWLLGLATLTSGGGFVHLLLVFAIAMVVLRVAGGRRAL